MTLKELALKGYVKIPYWLSSTSTEYDGSGSVTGASTLSTDPQKTNIWKTAWQNVWQSLQGSTSLSVNSTKNFGNNDPYNDGTSYNLGSGRFIGLLEHINRFHLGNEFGSAANSEVFVEGFEDPTYLTFKIEFGEWGASINDNNTIASIQRSSMATNTLFMDYDCFPMGLLDLNFKTSSSLNFNSQTQYNVYNWLLSRNEDRRALYIQEFIKGLYDVLRDFPYLFNKISGLEKLTDQDANRGTRLKDVTISLNCLSESIDLKIRTLMELYRKAVWNDVYQRWEVPDIYRYFKMIIYVFDQRCLHMGGGLFSPDLDAFPIMALECGPCEFVIKNQNLNEYSTIYGDSHANEQTIDIRILNVKTLYANQMFQNVKYINDIISEQEHWSYKDSNMTQLNGQRINWRYVWLQRQFMLPDEYNAYYRATESDSGISHYMGDQNDDSQFPLAYATMEEPEDTWHLATVTDEAYVINSWSSLWNAVKSIVTKNAVMIRDSRQSDRYYFKNDLNHINIDTLPYYILNNFVSIDMENVRSDLERYVEKLISQLRDYSMILDTHHQPMIVDASIIMNLEHYSENLLEMEFNTDKQIEVLDTSLYSNEQPDMSFNQMNFNLTKPDPETMQEMIFNLSKATENLLKMDFNLSKYDEELQPMIFNLDKITEKMTPLENSYNNIKLSLQELNNDLTKPEMTMATMRQDVRKLEEDMVSMIFNTDLPLMDMNTVNFNLEKYKESLQPMIMNLERQTEVFGLMEINTDKQKEDMLAMRLNLTKFAETLTEMFINDEKYTEELTSLKLNLDKPENDMQEMQFNLDKYDEDLVPMNFNLEKLKEDLIKMIFNLEKQKEILIDTAFNTDKSEMDMSNQLIIDDSKTEMDMTSPVFNLVKSDDVKMSSIDVTTDIEHSKMQDMIFNTSKPDAESQLISANFITDDTKESMNEPMFDDSKIKDMDMTNPVFNTTIKHSTLMNNIDINTSKNEMTMTETVFNSEKNSMVMSSTIINDDKNQQPLIENMTSDSLNHAPMISNTNINSSANIPMVGINENTNKVEHNFEHIIINDNNENTGIFNSDLVISSSKVESPMNEPVIILKDELKLTNIELINNEHQQKQNMINALIDNSKSPEMQMNNMLNTNDKESNMKMKHIELTSLKNDSDNFSPILSKDVDVEFTDVELVKNLEKEDMEMVHIDLNLKKTEDLVDVELVENDKLEDMNMSGLDENLLKNENQTMEPIEQEESRLTKEVTMKPIISEQLANKILNFTSLDTDSLKTASVADMNKLIGLMESTVREIKAEMSNSLIDEKIGKSLMLRDGMTLMKGYEHHTFGTDLIKVDAKAFDRALNALRNAKERMKLNGNKNQ